MNDKVTCMVHQLDKETQSIGATSTLHLGGSKHSKFLAAVKSRAEVLGLTTKFDRRARYSEPVLVDLETAPPVPKLRKRDDIDNVCHDGASCCAEAVFRIIEAYDMPETNVVVIGRKHAVQGLFDILDANNYTPLLCHSRTRGIGRITSAADIVVNSATAEPEGVSLAGKLVIDISGTLCEAAEHTRVLCVARGDRPPTYIGPHDVGRLNVSIVLNRFVRMS